MDGMSRFLSRRGKRSAGEKSKSLNNIEEVSEVLSPASPRGRRRMFHWGSGFMINGATDDHDEDPLCTRRSASTVYCLPVCSSHPTDTDHQAPPPVQPDLYNIFYVEDDKKQDKEEEKKKVRVPS